MDIKRVGVVGCGLLGAGTAQVAAQAGYDTIAREQKQLIQAKRDTANQQRNADERDVTMPGPYFPGQIPSPY